MTAQLPPSPVFQAFGSNGAPLAFGQLFTYIAGTSTSQATWTDSTQVTQNTNPVVLNAFGQANVWTDPNKVYKFILQDALGNQLYAIDNIQGAGAVTSLLNSFGVDSGSTNAYVYTHAAASAGATLTVGALIRFTPLNTNTGAVTVNADGTGAVAAVRANGTACTGGEFSSLGPVVLQSTGTQWQIVSTAGAQPGYERTAAEIAAGVTPTNYAYAPGDLRRYGAVPGAVQDASAAWASAVAQCGQAGGSEIRIVGGYLILTGVTATAPIRIRGDGQNFNYLTTTADINMLTLPTAASRSSISDVQFIGKGAGATLSGIRLQGCSYCCFTRTYVRLFGYGLKLETAGSSCFLNTLVDCQIVSNNIDNINGQAQTNSLNLHGTTFGGAPAQRGLYLVDSSNLACYSFDCEGVSLCGIDLDATVAGIGGHVLDGGDLEANTASAGDIRIGNTAIVKGVTIRSISFSPGAGNPYAINPLKADGLTVSGCILLSGYATSTVNTSGTLTNYRAFGNSNNMGPDTIIGGAQALAQVTANESAGGGAAIDASKGNQFTFTVTDNTAFAVNAPNNPTTGQRITITIRNTSGGALGTVSWNALFKLAAWTSPANGNSRSIDFEYDGNNWIERARTPNDVPN